MTQSTKTEKAESVTAEVYAFETIEVKRSFPFEKDDKIVVRAMAYQLGGNSHPHFSVTASTRDMGGCLHDEISNVWPEIKPIIDLHLSNADDGEPMYAEANGYYWLAGAVGGLGEEYHGGSGSGAKTGDECLTILANYLRISKQDADKLAASIHSTYMERIATKEQQADSRLRAQAQFRAYVLSQRPRWQREAKEGIELIKTLAG